MEPPPPFNLRLAIPFWPSPSSSPSLKLPLPPTDLPFPTNLGLFLGKKKSKKSLKAADSSKSSSGEDKLWVKPINPFSPSTENNDLKESEFTVPKSFPPMGRRSSGIPKVLSNDSLAVGDSAGEAAYEGGDEHDEIQSMKRDYSDFDLEAKGEDTDLNYNFGSEIKVETDQGITPELMLASGHISDPGMGRTAFWGSPVLKRSCSNIETKRASKLINSLESSYYSNHQNLSGNGRREITYETHSSPLSVKTSCSADRVMLKKHSSSQVLPSRSRKLWWKLFLWSHRNLHMPNIPQGTVAVLSAPNQKDGYSSDIHEPGQKLDIKKKNKAIAAENQWVAFSLESSPLDRVDAWVNSLENCAFSAIDIEDEGTTGLPHFEIGESSGKNHSHTTRRVVEEVMQANNVIRSLNSFSSMAHISGMGLKVIPTISAFVCLKSVNLSGNFIVHITPGSLPKSLNTLDLSRNKISTIEGLRDLTRLRVLNLSYNRISKIGHGELTTLQLGKYFLSSCVSRGVKSAEFLLVGLSNCTLIKELYLAGNKISDVEGLHRLLKLTVLDLSFNKITTAKALGQLVANYNSLLALNLIGNPIQSNIGDEQMKKAVVSLLPHLSYLNKQPIKQQRVREVATSSVAKAALGDAGWSSRRRITTRRSGHGSSSSSRSKAGEGSSKGSRHQPKSRNLHSALGRK
ncbi:Leucine-rich repeat-containing protein ODA7 [Apostasia shenzhenica]|uniref:Leucine-rich repeat-containing protein ODA7 n=1 Tax=Apostasia shenzhenica TaxID=1088818 RepID=A0A2I0AVA7_9ASPA|nr:Leucine-rich repeat-containing protein ODA7 [Apostasia shenzhenica]